MRAVHIQREGVRMAKKKTAKAKKKPALSGSARRAEGRKTGPRSQVLPGMAQVRSKRLDNLCEGIAECRETKNGAVLEEKSLEESALQTMVRENKAVYRHGGVELARIPGAERLRVRLTKETGDADASDLQEAEADVTEAMAGGGETSEA